MRGLLAFSLLLASGLAAAQEGGWSADEEEIDRTDFTETHLKSDVAEGPSSDVEPAALLPGLSDDGKIPVGIENVLLVSLANLGSKMFNVTGIQGSLMTSSGKRVDSYAQRYYGEALSPREQRSFRYGFSPNPEIVLGEYRLTFSVFYANKDKDPFTDVVYNETIQLVPKPVPQDEKLMFYGAVAGAAVLLIVLFYLATGSGAPTAEASASKKTRATSAANGGADESEWLQGTLAGSAGKQAKRKKA